MQWPGTFQKYKKNFHKCMQRPGTLLQKNFLYNEKKFIHNENISSQL